MVKSPRIEKSKRVYVNRSLNMDKIKAIGFDMDHTLARYRREEFEKLAFQETLKKAIAAGYPPDLKNLRFDPNFLIRGLLVDVENGNILKVDTHKYVKVAYHGHQLLSKDDRDRLYNREGYKAERFISVDTFFALSEVQLFVELVEYMNQSPGAIQKSFHEVYDDVKKFIDMSHQDNSIKAKVCENPSKYIHNDPLLGPTLERLINSGKTLFLCTNSKWVYTEIIMKYLLNNANPDLPHWQDYFEYVFVGSGKPEFFTGRQPFYEVITDSNLLKFSQGKLTPHKVYHGGCAHIFQESSGLRGHEILYVGDHIYGDVIQSKGSFNWRTMLIVEELEQEIRSLEKIDEKLDVILGLLEEREQIDESLHILLTKRTKLQTKLAEAKRKDIVRKVENYQKKLDIIEQDTDTLATKLATLDQEVRQDVEYRDKAVHPVWGELMRTGLERSRFANQLAAYACIYSSSVSNLRFYSPFKRFLSNHDIMPHNI